jgi:hypothetical protein
MRLGVVTLGIAAIAIAFSAASTYALEVPTPPASSASGGTLIDDTEAGWTWSGLVEYDDSQLHGGSGHAGGPGSYAVYTFHGTSVQVFAMRAPSITVDGRHHRVGSLEISIDDHVKAAEPLNSSTNDYGYQAFSESGLSNSMHVLKLDPQDGWVVIDYIKVNGDPSADAPVDAKNAKTADDEEPLIIPEGDYRICPRIAQGSNLDEKDWGTTDGNPLIIWKNGDHQKNQWFHIVPLGKGKYWMATLNAPQEAVTMLTPAQGETTIPAGQWRYTGHPAQIWSMIRTKDGWCRLSPSDAPSFALTVSGGVSGDGTFIICQRWDEKNQAQDWTILAY